MRLGSRREGPEEQGGGGMANAPSMKRKLPAAVSAAGCLRRREEAPVKYVRGFFFPGVCSEDFVGRAHSQPVGCALGQATETRTAFGQLAFHLSRMRRI